jgi:phosphoglycerol transferase MdoB-like AlkP superfamily enzyme
MYITSCNKTVVATVVGKALSWMGIKPLLSNRRASLWTVLLISVWFLEILIVQECTSLPSDTFPTHSAIKYSACRAILNVLMCAFLLCALNRVWLYSIFILELAVSNLLIVYADYFDAPLSWFTIRHQWQEGFAVADYGLVLVRWPVLFALIIALIIKVAIRQRIHKSTNGSVKLMRVAVATFVAYAIFAGWLVGYYKPISKLFLGSPEYSYGYVLAWTAEAALIDEEQILQTAIETAQRRSDRLASQEALLQLGDRLTVVQIESLGMDVTDAQVDGKWVMPFLHDLKSRSMFFVVEPAHKTGSSDADFTVLTDSMPNDRIAPFRIEKFPYSLTLPEIARQHGFQCIAMHGNTGSFFNRRFAYQKMGFSEIFFAEELHKLGCQIPHGGVLDEDLFRLSAEWMRQAEEPTMHFLITLTSHGPFNRLKPEQRELFPQPANKAEAYLGCMRYVDRALEKYVNALPDGTVVVIYGDHESGVEGFQSTPRASKEQVPWLIHRKGEDLAQVQKSRENEAMESSQLQQLDMATYLLKSLNQSPVRDSTILSAGKTDGRQRPS